MNFLRALKEKYMKSDLALFIIAVILSLFLWLYIAIALSPTVQTTVHHIPVSVDISGSNASMNGLSVFSCDVTEVTAEIQGSRTQVGSLNSETLEAYFDSDYISTPGNKNMTLKLRSKNGAEFNVRSIFPASASVMFDKLDTREFVLEPEIPNVVPVSGKQINTDETVCQPSAIRITGPSSKLDMIARVKAVHSKSESLSTSQILDCDDIRLYTKDNALIDPTSLNFSDSNIKIAVQIRTQKEVKLNVAISGIPEKFIRDTVKLKLSVDSIVLACNNGQVEIPDTLEIGTVSLSDLKPGFSRTLNLNQSLESTEFKNVSDVEYVTVELVSDDLIQRDLILTKDRISIINPPDDANYEYSVLTKKLNISIVGPANVIDQISADDIAAEVNLLAATPNSEQFSWSANFSCPEHGNVWVVTNSKVSIQRTQKTANGTTN